MLRVSGPRVYRGTVMRKDDNLALRLMLLDPFDLLVEPCKVLAVFLYVAIKGPASDAVLLMEVCEQSCYV